jgi:hypothetical protein
MKDAYRLGCVNPSERETCFDFYTPNPTREYMTVKKFKKYIFNTRVYRERFCFSFSFFFSDFPTRGGETTVQLHRRIEKKDTIDFNIPRSILFL